MKYILAILVLIGSVFAQNTTYKDGTECNCDSIHREYDRYDKYAKIVCETPYVNGNKHGKVKSYSRYDGSVIGESSYANGKMHGSSIRYENVRMLTADSVFSDVRIVSEEVVYVNGLVTKRIGYSKRSTDVGKIATIQWYSELTNTNNNRPHSEFYNGVIEDSISVMYIYRYS